MSDTDTSIAIRQLPAYMQEYDEALLGQIFGVPDEDGVLQGGIMDAEAYPDLFKVPDYVQAGEDPLQSAVYQTFDTPEERQAFMDRANTYFMDAEGKARYLPDAASQFKTGADTISDALTDYFPDAQNYIDDGRILGWHVWKVINGAQSPFTHLAVTVYDMDIMDEDYVGKKWTEEFTDMTQSELMDWARKNRENRKIVFETQIVNVAEVLQKGVTDYPDIAVMNLMKVKHGKYKAYEDMEKATTKTIAKGSPRKGWSLGKRIDKPFDLPGTVRN